MRTKNNLYYLCLRTLSYGLILTILLCGKIPAYMDYYSVLTVIGFMASVVICELIWDSINLSKYLIVYLAILIGLISFTIYLTVQLTDMESDVNRVTIVEKKLENIIFNAPKPVIISDGNGTIKFANYHAEKYVGLTAKELAGRNISEFLESQYFIGACQKIKSGEVRWIDVGNRIFIIKNFKGFSHPTRISLLVTRFEKKSSNDLELYIIITNAY